MNEQTGTGLVCRDLLMMPHLEGATVLAGEKGLGTPVIRVNVMEVPDVIDWVRPGEFLISTGYPFREQPNAFAELIPQLVEKGVAALGIKTKRFLDEIPPSVLEVAERYQFPIIELPPGTVFSEVVREVMERILVHEAAQLSLLQRRFQQLSELLLEGKGMEDLLGRLENELANPILLLSSVGKLHVSRQTDEFLQQFSLKQSLPLDQLQKDRNLGLSTLMIGEREVRVSITKIQEQQDTESLLFLLEWNRELTALDTLTLERVGVLINLEMMNVYARREVEAKYIDQFLQDWIVGKIVTRRDMNLRAEACGCPIDHDASFHVVLIRWLNVVPSDMQLKRIVGQLRQQDSMRSREMLFTLVDNRLVVLLSYESGLKEQELKLRLQTALQEANFTLSPFAFSFCLGKAVFSAEKVKESYLQASRVYDISRICGMQQEWISYEDLGIYKILYLLPQGQELNNFREEWMTPLENYDLKHHSSLIETLHTYFEQNENIRKTSQKLYTHHNTVIYRLERVKELLGVDLQGANERLQLQLALKLYAMELGFTAPANRDLEGQGPVFKIE